MNFSLGLLYSIGIGFLLALLGIAYATNRDYISKRIARHPATFILALGVYASAWSFYGAIGLAHDYGYAFMASYVGASISFILAPIILLPLLRITKSYQLSSIADLFAFRFRSQLAGTLVTVMMLVASLPLMSMQIDAVTDSTQLLSGSSDSNTIALVFCLSIALFAVLFGSRHPSIRHNTAGLVVAMAAGGVIKLLALFTLALFAIYGVFGSNAQMEVWLAEDISRSSLLNQPIEGDYWRTLLLGFMTSVVVMPHMFHLLFNENSDRRVLCKASWGFPLLMLLLSISIPPILWAGLALKIDARPEYFSLMLGHYTQTPLLSLLAYLGGLAAACGLLIVTTIALAGMALNHLILPFLPLQSSTHLYPKLVWSRRLLMVLITLLGYLFFRFTDAQTALYQMGLIAFIAFLQFLPGLLATLFWPGATRKGFVFGLSAGMTIWLISMVGPLVPHSPLFASMLQLTSGSWHEVATLALAVNIIIFVMLSILEKASSDEQLAANSCILSALHRPQSVRAPLADIGSLINRLAVRLGQESAQREVKLALQKLQLDASETRPQALDQLQDQLEINLSALLGPVEAISLLSLEHTPSDSFRRRDIHLLESHLEQSQDQLSGLAAELDELRRLHRTTLQRLPIGVCSLGEAGQVLLWNAELEHFTGVPGAQVLGQRLDALPTPWRELLSRFAHKADLSSPNQRLTIDGQPRFFSLHKATLTEQEPPGQSHAHAHQVLLLEDQTENQLLADELAHSERLASIGRLAAGVAHEIGNPITGIACLAQNLSFETDPAELLKASDQILQQTERVDSILKSLMNFAHGGDSYRPESQHLLRPYDCVKQAIELVRLDPRRKQRNYLNLCDHQLQLQGDPQRLLQVIVNLLNNAADASESGTSVRIQSYETDASVLIHIEDQGCGIPEELQKRLFEPFFTTKEPGQGTGLGLSLIYSIIQEHYGSVQIESPVDVAENRGTRVILTLPRISTSPLGDRDSRNRDSTT
ncbi:MAG: Na+/proline symporter/signal transduction histidine kinase [Motiliproteus sp.]|jgi:Na+/proline symporter/signal transduction histidine kinase